MHVPDGYLSPATAIVSYAAAAPALAYGLKKVKEDFQEENLALLSTVTALSFMAMMLNIPIPGGTSGHAIGTAVIAILFNPYFAAVAIGLVLIIQALLFGDGGVTALGLNIFAMGITASFVGYYAYHLTKKFLNEKIALFFSGWLSIVCASVVIAVVLGIQPLIASDPSGKPLYFPFDLKVTIPAIVFSHMVYFGVAEGIYTLLVISFVNKYYFKNENSA